MNDLSYVDGMMGIWVEAKQDTDLTVSGNFPTTFTISLCTGWNLTSYTGNQSRPIVETLSSISGKYERVYSYRADDVSDPWKMYDPSAPSFINDLTVLEPGLGYWIEVNENCTLTFSQ